MAKKDDLKVNEIPQYIETPRPLTDAQVKAIHDLQIPTLAPDVASEAKPAELVYLVGKCPVCYAVPAHTMGGQVVIVTCGTCHKVIAR